MRGVHESDNQLIGCVRADGVGNLAAGFPVRTQLLRASLRALDRWLKDDHSHWQAAEEGDRFAPRGRGPPEYLRSVQPLSPLGTELLVAELDDRRSFMKRSVGSHKNAGYGNRKGEKMRMRGLVIAIGGLLALFGAASGGFG
jgi:hypothetical protein